MISGLPLLHELLNAPLVVKLLQADGTTVVASASVMFDPLAQGLDQFSVNGLMLSASDSQNTSAPNVQLDVEVLRLWDM